MTGRARRQSEWAYKLRLPLPSGKALEVNRMGSSGLHIAIAPYPRRPCRDRSPLELAGLSADNLAYIERALKTDAEPRTRLILPAPEGTTQKTRSQFTQASNRGVGGFEPIDTMANGMGAYAGAAPKDDWQL